MGLIIDKELIDDGRTVVLGISGGPDSVCLLFELVALDKARREAGGKGNPVVCAHINHGLRGAESDGDEAYVRNLCGKLGVVLETLRVDAALIAKERGFTVEEAGREIRYAFFDDLCRGGGDNGDGSGEDNGDGSLEDNGDGSLCLDVSRQREPSPLSSREPSPLSSPEPPPFSPPLSPTIAVAHNQDDQVETVLMRILRGTGVDGLAGISPRRKSAAGYEIVRPLLGASRKEIEKQLAYYGETARVDGSNEKTEYFRNKVRLEILPWLEEAAGFNLRQSLLRLSENAAEDKAYFDAVIGAALGDNGEDNGGGSAEDNGGGSAEEDNGDGSLCLDTSRQREPSPLSSSAEPPPLSSAEPPPLSSIPAEMLAGAHPAIRHRLIRAIFAELGLCRDIAAVHLAAADRLLKTWETGGEASGKRVEFPFDFTFGIEGKKAVFRTPGAAKESWKPRR